MSFLSGGQLFSDTIIKQFVYIFIVLFIVWAGLTSITKYAVTNNSILIAITNDVIIYAITNDVIKYAITNNVINVQSQMMWSNMQSQII